MDLGLTGRRVLVSGGARGIGRAIVECFINEGAQVALRASDAAAVVLISSVSGREVDLFAEPYAVRKAALIHYGKTLSVRRAAERIRVNTVSPGNVYFADGVWGDIERGQPDLFASSLAADPLGRMATPAEVAQATVFLASGAASFITGTNLLIDGGLTRGVQF